MDELLLTIGFFVAGSALLWLFVWSWRGRSRRSRWWYRDHQGSDSIAMGLCPGAGIVLVAVGLLRVLPEAVSGIAIVLIVIGALVAVVGMVVPMLWGPAFYREHLRRERARARRR